MLPEAAVADIVYSIFNGKYNVLSDREEMPRVQAETGSTTARVVSVWVVELVRRESVLAGSFCAQTYSLFVTKMSFRFSPSDRHQERERASSAGLLASVGHAFRSLLFGKQ